MKKTSSETFTFFTTWSEDIEAVVSALESIFDHKYKHVKKHELFGSHFGAYQENQMVATERNN